MLDKLPTELLQLVGTFLPCHTKDRLSRVSKEIGDVISRTHKARGAEFKWFHCLGANSVLTGLGISLDTGGKPLVHKVNPAVACLHCGHFISDDSALLPFLPRHKGDVKESVSSEFLTLNKDDTPFHQERRTYPTCPSPSSGPPVAVEVIFHDYGIFRKKTFAVCSLQCFSHINSETFYEVLVMEGCERMSRSQQPRDYPMRMEGFVISGNIVTDVRVLAGRTVVKFQRLITHSSNMKVTTFHSASGLMLTVGVEKWKPEREPCMNGCGYPEVFMLSHPAIFSFAHEQGTPFFERVEEFRSLRSRDSTTTHVPIGQYYHPSQDILHRNDKQHCEELQVYVASAMEDAKTYFSLYPVYDPSIGAFIEYGYSMITKIKDKYYEDEPDERIWSLVSVVDTSQYDDNPIRIFNIHEVMLSLRIASTVEIDWESAWSPYQFGENTIDLTITSFSHPRCTTHLNVTRPELIEEDELLSDEVLSDIEEEGEY